jgi:hypothetical protein
MKKPSLRTLKSIQKKTLAHYDRMIEWAKIQHPSGLVKIRHMKNDLGESWGGDYCEYCNKFYIYIEMDASETCSFCPLANSQKYCCNELWQKMSLSHTWKTWINYATQVRDYIERNGLILK